MMSRKKASAEADEEDDEADRARARRRQKEDEEEDNTSLPRADGRNAEADGAGEICHHHRLFKKFSKLQGTASRPWRLGNAFSAADEKKYQKLSEDLTAEVESVQFHAAKIEYLVDQLYSFNRRLTALGGQMLRLAERHKVPRKTSLTTLYGPRAGRKLAGKRGAARQEMGRLCGQ
jgi:RNA polymerase primary sigma factor